jgi:hypothetical protein
VANPKNSPTTRWSGLLSSVGSVPRTFWFSVVGPLFLLIGGYFAWIQYGAPNLDRAMYGLKVENILITPKPPWIKSDVTTEVFQGADLGRLSVLDRQMSSTVFNAYRTHPWIRKVFRVQKLSGCQVRIDVEYREPIAMIYWETPSTNGAPQLKIRTGGSPEGDGKPGSSIPGSSGNVTENKSASFVPVDADGVLLPWRDFQSDEVLQYFLIYAKNASATGKVGAEYGDVRIKAALLLCRILKDYRKQLGLERIYVYPSASPDGSQTASKWILELTTHTNQRFLWGSPPAFERPGEATAEMKAERLMQLTQRPTPDQAKLTEFDLTKTSKISVDTPVQ